MLCEWCAATLVMTRKNHGATVPPSRKRPSQNTLLPLARRFPTGPPPPPKLALPLSLRVLIPLRPPAPTQPRPSKDWDLPARSCLRERQGHKLLPTD